MIGLAKIVGLSAVLSASFVGVYEAPGHASATVAKSFTARLPIEATQRSNLTVASASAKQGEPTAVRKTENATTAELDTKPQNACAGQTWPYISRDCVLADGAAVRAPVRTITIEQRQGASTSVLTRVPATTVATH